MEDKMQKVVNNPQDVVDESVEGFVSALPHLVAKTDNPRVLLSGVSNHIFVPSV